MNSILRPSTPPIALICSIASFSACTEPVSLMAMVPVTECRMPTLTVVSVTARPVVLTSAWVAVAATIASDATRVFKLLSNGRRELPVLICCLLMVYPHRLLKSQELSFNATSFNAFTSLSQYRHGVPTVPILRVQQASAHSTNAPDAYVI